MFKMVHKQVSLKTAILSSKTKFMYFLWLDIIVKSLAYIWVDFLWLQFTISILQKKYFPEKILLVDQTILLTDSEVWGKDRVRILLYNLF